VPRETTQFFQREEGICSGSRGVFARDLETKRNCFSPEMGRKTFFLGKEPKKGDRHFLRGRTKGSSHNGTEFLGTKIRDHNMEDIP